MGDSKNDSVRTGLSILTITSLFSSSSRWSGRSSLSCGASLVVLLAVALSGIDETLRPHKARHGVHGLAGRALQHKQSSPGVFSEQTELFHADLDLVAKGRDVADDLTDSDQRAEHAEKADTSTNVAGC